LENAGADPVPTKPNNMVMEREHIIEEEVKVIFPKNTDVHRDRRMIDMSKSRVLV
jgi:hypothetical protein